MDIRVVRRRNFELLIQEADTIANLARLTQTSDKYLRHIFNGFTGNDRKSPRQVGDDLARKLEAGMGKPHGWMDTAHDPVAQNDPSPLLNPRHQALLQLFESVTESDQQEVMRLLSEKKERHDEVIADWLKKQQAKKSAA